jgi:ATP-dependent RNA helicase DDX52/ROK1
LYNVRRSKQHNRQPTGTQSSPEINKHALGSFRSEETDRCTLGTNGGLEHEIEGERLGDVVLRVGGRLRVVLHQHSIQFLLNQIDEILSHCTNERLQRALFSATIGPLVQNLANSVLKTPIQISIGVENSGASTINQKLIFVGREEGKLLGIRQLIQQGITPPVLIFMQSKDRAKELFLELVYDGIHVDVIHAERTAQQREEVIKQFRLGKIWVLICTDLMARGVDFKGVQMVINYDFPQSAVSYIHRIGRTGRAGRTGTAVTFFTEEDIPRLRAIANVMKLSGCEIPDWIMSIKQVVLVLTTFLVIVSFERSAQMSTKMKRKLRTQAPDRRSISTVPKFDRDAHAKKKQIVEQSKEKKARVRANSDDS